MPPSDIGDVEIDEILDKLSTEEAVSLIAGVGPWYTAPIERLGILAIKVRFLIAPTYSCYLTRRRLVVVRMARGIV
jgi:hypothetical protein